MNLKSKHQGEERATQAAERDERLAALREDILEETAAAPEAEKPRFGRELPSQMRPPRWLLYGMAVLIAVLLVAVLLQPAPTSSTAVAPTPDISILTEEGAPVPPILSGPQALPDAPPPSVPPVDLNSPYPDG